MGFKKTVEDFTCAHCGANVVGNGYTNHCPKCLWSKHVDVKPGDRAAICGGMMEPTSLEGTTPNYRIIHVCQKCGFSHPNALDENDDPQAILAIAGIH